MIIEHKFAHQLTDSEKLQVLEVFQDDLSFETRAEKLAFEDRWMGPYFNDLPDLSHFFLVKDNSQLNVTGYLVASFDSEKFLPAFVDRVTSYAVFKDLFSTFPAHLHINLSSKCRGAGLGSALLKALLKLLIENKVRGVHLVTSPLARNVNFYRKNGFTVEYKRPFKGTELLFMGKSLQH